MANPRHRLASNASGPFYVDSSCIDCGTCRWLAPDSFDAKGKYARVYRQPTGEGQRVAALKALVSCPSASIGVVNGGGADDRASGSSIRQVAASFPDPIEPDVYHCGFHSEDSFGAASYFITRPGGNVLIDSPRFTRGLVRRMEAMGGVALMFLTHRDDVADHEKFRDHFGCDRVMHEEDVRPNTAGVEVRVRGREVHRIADDLEVIPTPGHTRGSACLLFRRRVLFSGDHVAWSRPMQRVYAFSGACWYDWRIQIESMERLAQFEFERILPGHSAPCHFPAPEMREQILACARWMRERR